MRGQVSRAAANASTLQISSQQIHDGELSPVSAKTHVVVGVGEILWDLLPGGKQLGGAPSNFAYITALLGDTGVVASRVGDDDLGREARQSLEKLSLRTANLQLDS